MISEKRYNGDGTTVIFPVEFKILGEQFLRVAVDEVVVANTDYDIINNSVVFNSDAVPAVGTENIVIHIASSTSELGDLPANQSSIDVVAANIANINEVAALDTSGIAQSVTDAQTAATAAQASAAGVNLPTVNTGDTGKILEVNVAEDGYDLVDKETGLPEVVTGDASKVLTVKEDESGYELADASGGASTSGTDGLINGTVTLSGTVDITSNTNPFGDSSLLAKYELDSNANDTTGTYNGATTNVTYNSGRFGNGAVFNGTSSEIDVAKGIQGDSTNFSWSLVFNSSKASGASTLLSTRDHTASKGLLLTIDTSGVLYLHLNGTSNTIYEAMFTPELNTTYHLVLTKSSGDYYKLYIDNVLVYTSTVTTSPNVLVNEYASIGYTRDVNGNYFEGLIDQVEIYNRVLTTLEILELSDQKDRSNAKPLISGNAMVSNGKETDGTYSNTSVALSHTYTTALTADTSWLWSDNLGAVSETAYEPQRGGYTNYIKQSASDTPYIYDVDTNLWHPTLNGELNSNPNFTSDINGWTASNGNSTISWDNGLKIVDNVADGSFNVGTNITCVAGETITVEVTRASGATNYMTIDDTTLYSPIEGIDTDLYQVFEFTATNTTHRVSVGDGASANNTTIYTKISIYNKQLKLDTALTNGFSGITKVLSTGGIAHTVIPMEFETMSNMVRAKEVISDKYTGKNACTAWVNFDSSTTPPTIKSSFNVADVVRDVEGRFSVYFETDMDNIEYSVTLGGNGRYNGIALMVGHGDDDTDAYFVDNIQISARGLNVVFKNPIDVNLHIFGGKN